jgi:hypothetical protein
MSSKIISNSRGQVSDTVTWIVATIIIILVLTTFVYTSSIFGKAKQVTLDQLSSFGQKNPVQLIDLLNTNGKTSGYEKESVGATYTEDKSVFAYLLSNDEESKNIIYNDLKSKGIDYKINEVKLNG